MSACVCLSTVAGRDPGVLPQRQGGPGGLQAGHEDGREHAEGAVQAETHPCHTRAGGQEEEEEEEGEGEGRGRGGGVEG